MDTSSELNCRHEIVYKYIFSCITNFILYQYARFMSTDEISGKVTNWLLYITNLPADPANFIN